MAHKVGSGSTKNNRDSNSKRLGLKIGNAQKVLSGQILVRQKGLKYKPGNHVGIGKDYTLYAKISGFAYFDKLRVITIR